MSIYPQSYPPPPVHPANPVHPVYCTANVAALMYGVSPYTLPPGLKFQIQVDRTLYEIPHLIDTLKKQIFINKGIIFGDFIVNDLQYEHAVKEFYKCIYNMYPPDKYNISNEWLSEIFNNTLFLPEYANRHKKYSNFIDIIISKNDFMKILTTLYQVLAPYFTIKTESHEYLNKIYPNLDIDSSIIKTVISFSNSILSQPFILNVFIDIKDSKDESNATGLLTLPNNIIEYLENYISHDGIKYGILSICPIKKIDNSTIVFEIINNVNNGIRTIMPYVDIELITREIKKHQLQSIQNTKNIQNTLKYNLLDYQIDNDTKLDYHLVINLQKLGSGSGSSILEESIICSGCNITIDSETEIFCKKKCCNKYLHCSCMLECYFTEDASIYKCNECNISKVDKKGKNSEILMGMVGL